MFSFLRRDEIGGAHDVYYSISFRNFERLFLQDRIKDQLGCPVQTLSRDQRQGLQNTTATDIESDHIPLLVRAHPLMGLWIKQVIFIAKTVLWPISQITEAGTVAVFYSSFQTLYYQY